MCHKSQETRQGFSGEETWTGKRRCLDTADSSVSNISRPRRSKHRQVRAGPAHPGPRQPNPPDYSHKAQGVAIAQKEYSTAAGCYTSSRVVPSYPHV
ncbi:hypothetical protein AAFF_G00280030 [Aldrovandia affinis]|uniref:Uncharacterized protein n=1 Tax=Aldrovandia affinis TaxID=143900 RepID=A0AAD7RA36_9TELE|nr:hypothetical protein AAFF_G00280030 [Aldrovandia affinis]